MNTTTRALLVLVLAAGAAWAGPVGDYLGYHVGRQTVDIRVGRDSCHREWAPVPDTIEVWSSIDSVTVAAETTYEGHTAWLVQTTAYRYDSTVTTDTLYEDGDSMMVQRRDMDTFHWCENLYRVPMAVGTWWRTGTAGTYYADFTGDNLTDTLEVLGDTVRVVGTEDVRLPYATVTGCRKLLTVEREALLFQEQGYPLRESIITRRYEWYKDSMSWVKDSECVRVGLYLWLGSWMLYESDIDVDQGFLDGYNPGIEEGSTPGTPPGVLDAWPNPCRAGATVTLRLATDGPVAIGIYDASGRLTAARAIDCAAGRGGTGELPFVIPRLAPGVYVLRVRAGGRTTAHKLIIQR